MALRACITILCLLVLAAPAAAQEAAPDFERRQILVVGDSLAVGMQPFLEAMLPESEITWDVRAGRTTPTGLLQLRSRLLEQTPQTVLVSLGTNDGSDPLRFTSRVRRALARIPPSACVIWASINRPPRKGAYVALNQVLRVEARLDRRLRIIDWNAAVVAGKVALPDGLHPDEAGYRYRSTMFANAVRRGCGR